MIHFTKRKKLLLASSLFPLVGISGFFIGKWTERWENRQQCHDESISIFENLPALPIFGTVSAEALLPIEQNLSGFSDGDNKISRTSQIMKYGFPSLDNVKSYQDFILSYDQRNRIAHWVFEHLSRKNIARNKNIDRANCKFREDPSVHAFFRSSNQDYKQSGFDRGHLAAAGNHRVCQDHVNETFLLTNIAPQVGPGFNRDIWNDLEKYVRKLARMHKNVYVCTGPLYLPKKENDGKTYIKYQVIGSNHVAVPTHFFKVVVMENDDDNFELESYVIPNQAIESGTPLHVFQVPPESIERAAGLLFFNRLSRNKLKRINNKKL